MGAMSVEGVTELELGPVPRGPKRHALQVYAEFYGRSVRTLEKWVGAPLDRPHLLAAWWRTKFKKRVPAEILVMEAAGVTGPTPFRPAAPVPSPPAPGTDEGPNGKFPDSIELHEQEPAGAADAALQARLHTGACWRRLRAATESGDPAEVARWQRAWEGALQIQRPWERDLAKMELEQGVAVSTAEVRAELGPRLGAVRSAFESAVATALSLPAPTGEAARRLETDRILGEVYRRLQDCKFLGDAGGDKITGAVNIEGILPARAGG